MKMGFYLVPPRQATRVKEVAPEQIGGDPSSEATSQCSVF
jgi:hypothetical protein